jgi:hypothetical protein
VGHLPLGGLVLGVSLAVRSGKHNENPAIAGEANHPVIIHASAAYRSDVGVYIDALGTVTPIYTINVFSQVSTARGALCDRALLCSCSSTNARSCHNLSNAANRKEKPL